MKQITFGELARSVNDEQYITIYKGNRDSCKREEAWHGKCENMPLGYFLRFEGLTVYDIEVSGDDLAISLEKESEGDE